MLYCVQNFNSIKLFSHEKNYCIDEFIREYEKRMDIK